MYQSAQDKNTRQKCEEPISDKDEICFLNIHSRLSPRGQQKLKESMVRFAEEERMSREMNPSEAHVL